MKSISVTHQQQVILLHCINWNGKLAWSKFVPARPCHNNFNLQSERYKAIDEESQHNCKTPHILFGLACLLESHKCESSRVPNRLLCPEENVSWGKDDGRGGYLKVRRSLQAVDQIRSYRFILALHLALKKSWISGTIEMEDWYSQILMSNGEDKEGNCLGRRSLLGVTLVEHSLDSKWPWIWQKQRSTCL